ncbi:MAG: 3D domain-containing protein [Polyangiaceae bacterium]
MRARKRFRTLSSAILYSGSLCVGLASACSPGASDWMAEPLVAPHEEWRNTPAYLATHQQTGAAPKQAKSAPEAGPKPVQAPLPASSIGPGRGEGQRSVGPEDLTPKNPGAANSGSRRLPTGSAGGRVIGTFKNTYYDFPAESELREGRPVSLFNATCQQVASVPQQFFERLCVQGSGMLSSGDTLSFAKRDCSCAATCSRTGQRLCFDRLDADKFPWGRGSTGRPIVALRSLAVDPGVVPMGSLVYVPEFDGLSLPGGVKHDGCFVAQDRGIWVKGAHIDVFAGTAEMRLHLEKQLPTNRGVHVVLDSPRCESAANSR